MDLGKLNRNDEDRSVVWAAVITAFTGLAALLAAIFANLAGQAPQAGTSLVIALVYFGLAYGVYRGSRAAAVVVVALFALVAAGALLLTGLSLLWIVLVLVWGVALWDGMRGVFARRARRLQSHPHP